MNCPRCDAKMRKYREQYKCPECGRFKRGVTKAARIKAAKKAWKTRRKRYGITGTTEKPLIISSVPPQSPLAPLTHSPLPNPYPLP